MGASRLSGAGRRVRPPLAGRAVPGRGGDLGAPHPTARSRPAVDGRSGPGGSSPGRRGSSTPSPATPLAITARRDLPWMLAAVRTEPTGNEPTRGTLGGHPGRAVITRGVLPFGNWQPRRDGCPPRSTEGLWDLVARGIVTADAFSAVRSLLSSRGRRPSGLRRVPGRRSPLGPRRALAGSGIGEGSSLVPDPDDGSSGTSTAPAAEELAEAVPGQMLVRWGVVAWDLWSHESYRVPWRDVVRALRRFEARRQAPLGGRFVAGVSGEQYALPEAASLLADVRRDLDRGADVVVAGADPLNHAGELMGGPRTPAIRHRSVHYLDGVPVDPTPVASAG